MTYVNHKILHYSSFYDPENSPYLNPATDRRVAIITGANSGIGWFTSLHLYLHGYITYIFGRSDLRVLKAIEDIQDEAERRLESYTDMEKSMRWLGELHYIYIDLRDLTTIGTAVNHFSMREKALHLLICNAGIMGIPYSRTKDEFEIQFQVNYVGHFLLTIKLLPLIKRVSVGGKVQPRIVSLSSIGHKFVYKHFKPSENLNKSPGYIFTWVRYGVSKLALIHFAKSLSKYHPDILSVSVHPGFALNSALYNYWKEMKFIGFFAKGLFMTGNNIIGVTNEEGSLATLRASLDTSLRAKTDGGKYFITGGQEALPTNEAMDENAAQELWDWTLTELQNRKFLLRNEAS